MNAETGLRILIAGRVQGVGFRYFTRNAAKVCGIRGYARNLVDGRVEVVAHGQPTALEQFLKELSKGPPLSAVRECLTEQMDNPGHFTEFTIRQ